MRKNKNRGYQQFQELDQLAYKLENGLSKLVQNLDRKRDEGD